MSSGNEELIASFVEEANETLADIENDFLAIEEAGENVDSELINKVFRGIHSMKGSAGFLGLKSIGTLAHEMENVLNLIRNKELVAKPKVVNTLLRGADTLRSMVNDILNSNDVDVSDHIEELKQAVTGESSPETQAIMNRDVDIALPDGRLAFVMIKEMDIVMRQRQQMHIFIAEADFFSDVQAKNRTPIDFIQSVHQHGELIDSYMSTAGIGDLSSDLPDAMSFMMLLGSKLSAEEIADHLQLPPDHIYHIATPEQTLWEPTGPQKPETNKPSAPSAAEEQPEAPKAQPADATATPKTEPPPKPPTSTMSEQTSLRVHVKVLDTLMNLAGELVLSRNQLMQEADSGGGRGMESVAARIDQVTSELQEAIMQTRMQPIGTIFNKFPRIVRDLSSHLQKQCELEIEGKEVEMDKTIIEAIGDPLTHLIRNSVDHGIETPEIRASSSKNPNGRIVLRAYHQAGKVNISISDDGAGIDGTKLRNKAVEKGILTPEQARELGDREAIRLIFHPGFSMAEKVSDVSGRGVGMDVVRTNIEKLGGTVDIETEIGVGTEIIVRLPLTLAIIPSLVVRCGEDRFAMPQVNISELVRIKASDVQKKIEKVKDAEVLRLRGHLLPLARLSEVLNMKAKYRDYIQDELKNDDRETIADRRSKPLDTLESDEETITEDVPVEEKRSKTDRRQNNAASALNILVVESGHLRYGLIVDELFDSKEIVVKPLGRHMKDCDCLAGATILGDGMVALILDVAGIAAHKSLTMPDTDSLKDSMAAHQTNTEETQSVLIFTNDPSEYFGIPTDFISRIERIKPEQIDSVGGQDVLQYRGTSLILLNLENHIQAKPRPDKSAFYVVVFKVDNREVGLVAPELIDIRQIPTIIDTTTFRETGILGSLIDNEKTIRLVDVYELVQNLRDTTDGDTEISIGGPASSKAKTILLAEDSNFFRQQLENILKGEGYEIVSFEDGALAWMALQNPDHHIDLVLTDIEMPNMNGLELANKIKTDTCFAHLPVIALTSLARDEDIKRGKAAGIDEYQIKLDREALLATITKYIKKLEMDSGIQTPKTETHTGK